MDYLQSRILPWDSEFFGFKTGRIDVSGTAPDIIDRAITELKEENCALIYVFSREAIDFSKLSEKDAVQVDLKRTYINRNPKPSGLPAHLPTEPFEGNASELYDLGIQAGIYSRFHTDPRIPDEDFRRLYRKWVDNSVDGSFADYVLVSRMNGKPIGFVTARMEDKAISIGLIAVSPEIRGHGVGRALVDKILEIGAQRGLPVEVVTQADNKPACAFYERLGFEILEDCPVYHVRPGHPDQI